METREHTQKRPGDNHQKIVLPEGLVYLFILILPFILLHRVFPFISDFTIGEDFLRFSLPQQIELMFSIKTGSFPLYAPGFAFGQSSSALTLGQLYHPIAWISSLMPGYWSGLAADWNILFKMITIGISQALLYTFLRKVSLRRLACFLLSFITAYNLQLINGFFYGASMESWTGHLMLCSSIGLYYLNPGKALWPLLVTGSTYWLVCSGHPQMMYYGLIGSALFTLFLPFFTAAVKDNGSPGLRSILPFWMKTLLLCSTGILLSSVYLIPYYFDFMTSSQGHIEKEYVWSNMYLNTLVGTINDFFQPLDGGAGFGGSSLVLVAALVPLIFLFPVRMPVVISAAWGLLLLVFLIIQGDRTPVHYIMWKFMPFASGMRVPQRMSMIMPVHFMMIMAWLLRPGTPPFGTIRFRGWGIPVNAPMILGLSAAIVMIAYIFLPPDLVTNTYRFSPRITQNVPTIVLSLSLVFGVAVLTIFVLMCSSTRFRRGAGLALCLLSIGQVFLLLHYGMPLEARQSVPTSIFKQIFDQKRTTLDYQYLFGEGTSMAGVIKQAEQAFLEPFLGVIYREHIPVMDNEEAYTRMQEGRSPDQVVIEGYKSPDSSMPGNSDSSIKGKPSVVLTYSTFNRMVFTASSPAPSFFGFSYPNSGHWKALVNGRFVPVYRANGISHTVELPPGDSLVEFRYWSDAVFWGMILSCLALSIVGIACIWLFASRKAGYVFCAACLVAGLGAFTAWHHSLYRGDNLETVYSWRSDAPATRANLAYGKRTYRSPNEYFDFLVQYPYLFSGGGAVDGDLSPRRCFITGLQKGPWWQVDLHRPQRIGSVVLYESPNRYFAGDPYNVRPLMLLFSMDGQNWNGSTFTHHGLKIKLPLLDPVTARYVMIRSPGICRLSFDEVEVYPPDLPCP